MYKKWQDEERKYLEKNYRIKTSAEMGVDLNRSSSSIRGELNRLCLRLSDEERIKRNSETTKKQFMDKRSGEMNPNWKGGISKNNYHYKKIQKERYPEKIRARELLSRAVKRGEIKKEPCIICGDKNSEAHHDNYCNPLKIKWLCKKHHRLIHCQHS